ncbi:MAG: T9SS type A sorting domain-containing protein [Bacteroidales bacterium]|nr:T9SS type A sorting domain-containing protein [Bacteroidales bacterium]
MKKLTILIVLSMMSLLMMAQKVEKTYRFDNPKVTELRGYQQISFDGCMQTALAGNPSLPYCMVSLMLPQGAEAESIEVELSDFQEIEGNFELFPYQPSRTMSDKTQNELVKNEAVYASRNVYPAENHGVVTTQYKNGYGFAFSSFTPVQYIPATGKVMYAKTANVRVNLKSAREDHGTMLWGTPEVLNSVKRLAQNPEMVENYPTKGRDVNAYDLLIITGAEFVDGYNEYCEYYNSIGLRNRIVTTADIYATMTGVDNQDMIRNYIIQEYQNNGILMVVLGGDVNIIPHRSFYCQVQSSSLYESNNIPADLYYSGLDGTWNDNGNNRYGEPGEDDLLPEIGVSRMSFKTATELQNMIHKTLTYQQTPVLGEFQKIILAGEHLYDNPTSNGSDYLELLIGTHDDNGYTTVGYPTDYDFTKLYEELGTWSGSALKQAINAGTGYVHHDGHANSGYVAGWYGISNSDFSGANGVDHNYTFFHSQGCDCGAFDEDCILEKMVTISNFAVAVIGNSRYGWFNEGQTEGPGAHLEREMTDAQFGDRIGLLSLAHADGKCMTAPWVTAPGQWEEGALRWNFYDMNVLGDGAVNVWLDEPMTAVVDAPAQVVIGTQSIEVTVTDENGNGLKNYRCLIYMDEDVIAMGATDENGVAEITFEGGLQSVGNMIMKVSGVNSYPQDVEMLAVPSDTPYVVYESYTLSGGAEQIDFGGSYAFNVVLKNVGSVNASNVTATMTCESEYVTIGQATANVGDVNGSQSVTLENAFDFTVSDDVPNNTNVRFFITCTDGSETWESHFNVRIYAPEIVLVSAVLETTTGAALNPGDAGTVHFTLKNDGGAAMPSAVFAVFNSHPEITIETSEWNYENVAAGEEFTADMAFTLSDEAQTGVMYELLYASYYGNYIIEGSYYIQVGQSMDGFETGDFTAFNWQFVSPIYAWTVVTQNPYEGQYCAKSSSIDHSESTSMSLTVMVGQESPMSFYYKVSSESNYDKLHFSVDGVEKNNWSGDIDWTIATYQLTAGTHVLRWEYTKDSSVSSGSDCAWIDNVIIPASAVITDVQEVVERNVTVYPNPANDVLNIELGDNQSDVVIYNSIGQVVRHIEMMSGNVQINVADLNSGIYFVRVNGNVTKIVKK